MFAEREGAVYVNYCHQCGRALSSAQVERCDRCAWLRCECGACGCSYEAPLARPLFATVPPGVAGGARHAEAVPLASRPAPANVWPFALLGVVLLVVGLLAVVRWGPQLRGDALPEAPVPAAGSAPAVGVAPTAAPAAAAPATVPDSAPAAAGAAPTVAATAPAVAGDVPSATLPATLYVANTDGVGAFIRSQPSDAVETRIFAWKDGTALVPLETRTVAEPGGSAVWVRVRDPRGQEGWVRQKYLSPRP